MLIFQVFHNLFRSSCWGVFFVVMVPVILVNPPRAGQKQTHLEYAQFTKSESGNFGGSTQADSYLEGVKFPQTKLSPRIS